ncbi:MAG: hypothetical protein Q9207_000855 [Kuettlingeria erythrocarpa]
MPADQPSKNGSEQQDDKPKDGDRLVSPIFIVSAGPNDKQYAVHEDILKQSRVLGRMCEGDFKEAHERRITLPDDDPIDVGILVEYLYMKHFSTGENPGGDVSKQDSALRLAHLYILADKYDLDGMKDVVVKKIHDCTDIDVPDDWLAIAEIIYAATPETDCKFPKYLRSLVFRFMEVQQRKGKNGFSALEKWVEKGGRLTIDICRGDRMSWVRRVTNRNGGLNRADQSMSEQQDQHRDLHEGCGHCFNEAWSLAEYGFNNHNLDSEVPFDESIMYPK